MKTLVLALTMLALANTAQAGNCHTVYRGNVVDQKSGDDLSGFPIAGEKKATYAFNGHDSSSLTLCILSEVSPKANIICTQSSSGKVNLIYNNSEVICTAR